LGRKADAVGSAFWVGQLVAGAGYTAVARGIATSPEARGLTVKNEYGLFLHRDPDAASRAAWTSYLASGHTIEQLDAALIASAEHYARSGGAGDRFIRQAFVGVLGRTPPDVSPWRSSLATQGRYAVAYSFLTSAESRN